MKYSITNWNLNNSTYTLDIKGSRGDCLNFISYIEGLISQPPFSLLSSLFLVGFSSVLSFFFFFGSFVLFVYLRFFKLRFDKYSLWGFSYSISFRRSFCYPFLYGPIMRRFSWSTRIELIILFDLKVLFFVVMSTQKLNGPYVLKFKHMGIVVLKLYIKFFNDLDAL